MNSAAVAVPVPPTAGPSSLSGSHAWVTGAGRGIGEATALALAGLGASTHLVSRTRDDLERVAARIEALNVESHVHVADVCDRDAVASLFDGAAVDVLVNAAGTNVPQPFVDVTDDVYERVMDVNVKAVIFVTQQAIVRMLEAGRGGAVINVTSQMAHVGGPNRSVYCASKAAVAGLTRALAVEFAPAGIRVNGVAPTFVETSMTAPFLADPDFRAWALAQIPLGRFGTVDEVASAIAFLASPAASLITGVNLLTDGGWTAR